jgi:hypothetical protein
VLEVIKNIAELTRSTTRRCAARFASARRTIGASSFAASASCCARTSPRRASAPAPAASSSHLNISSASSEAVQAHLETRFDLLEVASNLELWQEAFKAIEDISDLMQRSGTRAKAQLMATYYEKLAQIFWVSSNYLFHAYAYYRYYSLCRTFKKSLTQGEIAPMASKLLLATLAIPPAAARASETELGGRRRREHRRRRADARVRRAEGEEPAHGDAARLCDAAAPRRAARRDSVEARARRREPRRRRRLQGVQRHQPPAHVLRQRQGAPRDWCRAMRRSRATCRTSSR